MKLTLTRYLYARDEVEASLLTSLLSKKDICESYFWAYELLCSGFDLFATLWKIYYDIYFEYNPSLETYIRKKHIEWEKQQQCDDAVFATILNNMFHAKPSCKVFMLRQDACIKNRTGGSSYRGRRPKWCDNHDKKYHGWVLAISKKDYRQIAYWTYDLVLGCTPTDALFAELIKYFGSDFTINSNVCSYWDDRKYRDDAHYLLAIIIQLLADVSLMATNIKVKTPRAEHLSWIQKLEPDASIRVYRVLKEQRKYGVNRSIGSFALARHELNVDALDMNRFWEYYAFQTPVWWGRFEKYNGALDNAAKRVVFDNDDDLEDFYDLFGLEPDEQSREVQNLSTAEIPRVPWVSWFEQAFAEESVVKFDETMRFAI